MPVARNRPVTLPLGEAGLLEDENVLQRDQVAFHADHSVRCVIRRVPSLKRAVCTNKSTARRNLLPDGAHTHVGVGHADHDFQAAHERPAGCWHGS